MSREKGVAASSKDTMNAHRGRLLLLLGRSISAVVGGRGSLLDIAVCNGRGAFVVRVDRLGDVRRVVLEGKREKRVYDPGGGEGEEPGLMNQGAKLSNWSTKEEGWGVRRTTAYKFFMPCEMEIFGLIALASPGSVGVTVRRSVTSARQLTPAL